ncbi:MAG TPA: glycerol-3-phosphate dehydrogenase [Terriglobia bacterium]|nr:glycerol-3-phosphate dehydrogenase [Terriglobia bacterium]
MRRDLEGLSKQKFDLAIIGGGIQGAATARDAAMRGLKVALVDAGDFAGATSSRSSKLIHGGLRYLEQHDFRLVHEARTERRLLLNLAPHLAQPVPFLLPIYQGDPYSPFKIRLGLTVYDLMGNLGRKDLHKMLSPSETLRRIPALRSEGLRAGAVYFDSETDDARLTLENILDAAEHGAVVANYTEIRALSKNQDSEVQTAEAVDLLTGGRHEVAARFWVNAAGPWVDRVRGLVAGYDGSRTVRLTKGTHIILPPVSGPFAMFAAILPGKRIFVMAPWHGHALLGTTDTDYEGDPAAVRPDRADTEYLLAALNRVLARPLGLGDVRCAFAGLRALAVQPGRSPSENTREYVLRQDPWAKNFVSICGGKLTTARALAEKVTDLVASKLGMGSLAASYPTRKTTLPGGQTGPFDVYVNYAAWEAVRLFDIQFPIAERIVKTYGSRWRAVLDPIRENRALAATLPGSPELLAAEVEFAIREEMAVRLGDFLLRRSGLNWFGAQALRDAAPAVADIFASRQGWDSSQRAEALNRFYEQAGHTTISAE